MSPRSSTTLGTGIATDLLAEGGAKARSDRFDDGGAAPRLRCSLLGLLGGGLAFCARTSRRQPRGRRWRRKRPRHAGGSRRCRLHRRRRRHGDARRTRALRLSDTRHAGRHGHGRRRELGHVGVPGHWEAGIRSEASPCRRTSARRETCSLTRVAVHELVLESIGPQRKNSELHGLSSFSRARGLRSQGVAR